MAKDKNKDSNAEIDRKLDLKNKIVSIILVVIFVVILFGGLIVYVKLDIGGFGSKVMRPVFKDVKIVNKILPDVQEDDLSDEKYQYSSISDAVKRIKVLEKDLDKLKGNYDDISSEVEKKDEEITRLQKYEKTQKEFDAQVADFNEKIVFNKNAPSASEYIKYYEKINPDNAANLYQKAINKNNENNKYKELSNTYAKMEPKAAAKAFEEMKNNMSLVCGILNGMGEKDRANIMNQMSASFLATVTEKMGR